jgi:hypothetical protein
LQPVIYGVTKQAPMVVYEQATPSRGSYIVSLSTNAAGIREQRCGDTIVIHVNFSTAVVPHIAAADVVTKALIQIDAQTRHVFLDYSYVKIKALQHNNLPITEMPLLKWLNGYHHHMHRLLYVTTTYLLFFVFVFMNSTLTHYVLLAN